MRNGVSGHCELLAGRWDAREHVPVERRSAVRHIGQVEGRVATDAISVRVLATVLQRGHPVIEKAMVVLGHGVQGRHAEGAAAPHRQLLRKGIDIPSGREGAPYQQPRRCGWPLRAKGSEAGSPCSQALPLHCARWTTGVSMASSVRDPPA